MTSFFRAIQNWFSADLHGRHLGLILQEIGARHPEALTRFISKACSISHKSLSNAKFQAEFCFDGKSGKRRADLAVFMEDELEPSVLIEIKYNDKPIPETYTKPAQLADYRVWRQGDETRRHVLLLSRELYSVRDIEVRRWTTLARHLRQYAPASDLISMLVQYLEEEGNAMQNIKGSALTKYIKRYLCHRKLGANNLDGPVEFANLLKNVQLMSGNFHSHFKASWKKAGVKLNGDAFHGRSKVASIDFEIWNRIKKPHTGTLLDEHGGLRSELKDGGELRVFARHSLGHEKHWLRVTYGVEFDVAPLDNEDDPPTTYLFAAIYGAALQRASVEIEERKKINFAWVTSQAESKSEKVEDCLCTLILEAIGQLQDAKLELLPQQRKGLLFLKRSLDSGSQPLLEAA